MAIRHEVVFLIPTVVGGRRIHDLELLEKRLDEHKLTREAFWYLGLRRFGTVPHAGFGIGAERFVAWICGLSTFAKPSPIRSRLYRSRP